MWNLQWIYRLQCSPSQCKINIVKRENESQKVAPTLSNGYKAERMRIKKLPHNQRPLWNMSLFSTIEAPYKYKLLDWVSYHSPSNLIEIMNPYSTINTPPSITLWDIIYVVTMHHSWEVLVYAFSLPTLTWQQPVGLDWCFIAMIKYLYFFVPRINSKANE